jgi:predicted nucleic acid-binding protein
VTRAVADTSRRLATVANVRSRYALLPIDAETGSCFARLADEALSAGRRLRRNDAWIAATALRHGVAVVTQDDDFSAFESVEVIRV